MTYEGFRTSLFIRQPIWVAIDGIFCILFDNAEKTIAIPFELLLPYAGYLKHRRPTLRFENGHLF